MHGDGIYFRRFFSALLLAVLSGFLTMPVHAAVRKTELHSGWQFRAMGTPPLPAALEWHAATVPGVVQTDLLQNKLIPDPFYGTNEAQLQWIGLTDWEYQTKFPVEAAVLAQEHVELVFDGLDTYADVFLNDQKVLEAGNMFRMWRVDVKKSVKAGDNTLRIVFHSPIMTWLPKLRNLPYHLLSVNTAQSGAEEGIPTDPYTRKAPYHYGWDWGPRFVTEGIWRAVRLESWDGARVADFHIAQPSINKDVARLTAEMEIEATAETIADITVTGSFHGKTAVSETRKERVYPGINKVLVPLKVEHPNLWYPADYGPQDRYQFTASVRVGKTEDRVQMMTGLRSIELRRQPDQWGKSFEFVVNGIAVYAKGANLIPFDSFLPRVTRDVHRQMLLDARAAHMNMVREWGGGAYESDDFFDLCDEMGILVWQEFMFGGAMVPGDAAFQDNVRQEAIDNVKRMRNHPSVVLFCGNNEMETGWKHWGDRQAFKDSVTLEVRERLWQDYVVLFHDVLKSVVHEYAPETPYWPSSPSANFDAPPDNQTDGDMHYWAVWHAQNPIEDYTKQAPRFMSEYGFQSFPEMSTIKRFAQPSDYDINSAVMRNHQKNTGGNERILTYMLREYREPKDFESFVYMSQVQQAEAIKVGAEHFRRMKPRNMGQFYWQLNDCWPVASWASIDYFGRWKALQYYAVRFFDDVLVSPWQHEGKIETYVISDKLQPMKANLKVRLMDFSGKVLSEKSTAIDVPAQSSAIYSSQTEQELLGTADPKTVFAEYELMDGEKVISRNEVFFARSRDLDLPSPNVDVKVASQGDKVVVTLKSSTLARHLALFFGDLDVQAADNYFDLLPGQEVSVAIRGKASVDRVRQALKVITLVDAERDSGKTVAQVGQ
jgi:beta-mannosidase